jgi:hypothetical protein
LDGCPESGSDEFEFIEKRGSADYMNYHQILKYDSVYWG